MDLDQFDIRAKAEDGVQVDLVINDETVIGDDGEPVWFLIKGAADPEVARLISAARKKTTKTVEDGIEQDMKILRAAVIGWSDNFVLRGERVPYSRKAVEQVFALHMVRVAIFEEIINTQNFMTGS